MKKIFLMLLLSLLLAAPGLAQTDGNAAGIETVTFRFVPGNDMFYIPWGGNDAELARLYSLVDEYRAEITAGRMPIDVDGYCASGNDMQENFKMAVVRSNRVKSELITHKGLAEDNFITKNHAAAYISADGKTYRDMVVVTLRIPVRAETVSPPRPTPEPQPEPAPKPQPKPEPVAVVEEVAGIAEPATPHTVKPYCFAIRTNLLYDAFLVPTLGVEWRITPKWGIKADFSGSYWGEETGDIQKMWFISPEVRRYLLENKRFYVGVGGNYGKYNIYGGMIGGMFPDDTGYQGSLWNAGVTVGYQLKLARSLSLDFNLGLGYTRFEYDSFGITDQVRVYKAKDQTTNFWGPTQAGVTLMWTIGSGK